MPGSFFLVNLRSEAPLSESAGHGPTPGPLAEPQPARRPGPAWDFKFELMSQATNAEVPGDHDVPGEKTARDVHS
eukprot:25079-Rhodomonas_salina.1